MRKTAAPASSGTILKLINCDKYTYSNHFHVCCIHVAATANTKNSFFLLYSTELVVREINSHLASFFLILPVNVQLLETRVEVSGKV